MNEDGVRSRAKTSVTIYANPPTKAGLRFGQISIARTLQPCRSSLRGLWEAVEVLVFLGGRRWLGTDVLQDDRVDLFIIPYKNWDMLNYVKPESDELSRMEVEKAVEDGRATLERLVALMVGEPQVKICFGPTTWVPEGAPESGEDCFEVIGLITD